jgi:hypothetical protein
MDSSVQESLVLRCTTNNGPKKSNDHMSSLRQIDNSRPKAWQTESHCMLNNGHKRAILSVDDGYSDEKRE